jgi:hypothetical protein
VQFFIAPAGSNVSYIQGIFAEQEITPALAYHHLKGTGNHTANLRHTPIDDQCTKIYFEKFLEIIILNWHYKLRINVDPDDHRYTQYGPDWEVSQKEAWKKFGNKWEIRAVVRWLYSIYNDVIYREKISPPGNNFNGCCLYEGFESAEKEFAKFGVNYTQKQFQAWQDSQKIILSVWKNMYKPNFVDNFKYDFEKGVYIGLHGIQNKITEEQAWESYIK